MASIEQRRFARLPLRVPLAVRPTDGTPEFEARVADLSEGGVAFLSRAVMCQGLAVELDVPVRRTLFTLHGVVITCLPLREGGFRVGLSFTAPDVSFKLKLAEQVLRVEELRAELSRERGAEVTSAEAAAVWVERYAESFAHFFDRTSSAPRR